MSALVAVLMGSKSDMDVMQPCMETLQKFDIAHEVHVMSAHRTPDKVRAFVSGAADAGYEVIIAAAGGAAALPGVCKAYTALPVIGVPLASSELKGVDALYSIVQMPPGMP
ncbi:MAG TPA: AIR carboxylase family protein, partial [Dehalococcoidia bacterium]|nr:AIR carboxylase family protein [Dehalococcoidia bacterium]